MQRLAHTAQHATLAALLSHTFCCGLPTVMNLVTLAAGAGALTAVAPWIGTVHFFMHRFELHLLVFSGVALLVGALAHWVSAKRDCARQISGHDSCATKKLPSRWLLVVATLLFVGNLTFFIFHD